MTLYISVLPFLFSLHLFTHVSDIYNNHLFVCKSDCDVSPAANHVTGNKQCYSPRVSRREQITMEERAIIGAV